MVTEPFRDATSHVVTKCVPGSVPYTRICFSWLSESGLPGSGNSVGIWHAVVCISQDGPAKMQGSRSLVGQVDGVVVRRW